MNNLLEKELQILKEKEEEKIKARCAKVFEQTSARYSCTGVLNSCGGFRLGWEMALHPLKDRVISGLDVYDLLNDVEVGNYDQVYYIEKDGMLINFVLEDEEEESIEEEPEDNPPHK